MEALKVIPTVYSNYTLIAGAHNVDPNKLTGHVVNEIVIGKVPLGICLARGLALRISD